MDISKAVNEKIQETWGGIADPCVVRTAFSDVQKGVGAVSVTCDMTFQSRGDYPQTAVVKTVEKALTLIENRVLAFADAITKSRAAGSREPHLETV